MYRTKRRFVEESLEGALSEDPRPGGKRKLTGGEEALLIATACSALPKGRSRWTLALLADAVVALTPHAGISRHTRRGVCGDMVAIEIGVLASQCLARRIPDITTLTTEVAAWTDGRNHARAVVKWMVGIEQARPKLGHAYPPHSAAAGNVAA